MVAFSAHVRSVGSWPSKLKPGIGSLDELAVVVTANRRGVQAATTFILKRLP